MASRQTAPGELQAQTIVMPKPKLSKTKVVIGTSVLLVLAVLLGYVAYDKYRDRKQANEANDLLYHPLVFQQGELENLPALEASPPASEQIARLEAKIAATPATFDDYLSLGQLYGAEGNKSKAIENYEKAKAAATPDMTYYKSIIKDIDASIAILREGN